MRKEREMKRHWKGCMVLEASRDPIYYVRSSFSPVTQPFDPAVIDTYVA
jgi:hypothetical protein